MPNEEQSQYERALRAEVVDLKTAGITITTTKKPAVIFVDTREYKNRDLRVQISRLSEEDPHLDVTFERAKQSLSALLGMKIEASGDISVTLQDDEGFVHIYRILRGVLKKNPESRTDPRPLDLSSIYY